MLPSGWFLFKEINQYDYLVSFVCKIYWRSIVQIHTLAIWWSADKKEISRKLFQEFERKYNSFEIRKFYLNHWISVVFFCIKNLFDVPLNIKNKDRHFLAIRKQFGMHDAMQPLYVCLMNTNSYKYSEQKLRKNKCSLKNNKLFT